MTIEKLDMQTQDITDGNVARVAELFPNVVTEGKDETGKVVRVIDFDALKQELSHNIVEGPQERYRLDWPGKREAMLAANTPITKTLRPVREESVNFDKTKNLFIEGDNLDALKLLQETYLGKVKMIYIDPPYNTGKDFIYKDNFTVDKDEYLESSGQTDETRGKLVANTDSNGRYHSDWLSMMYPRLKMAKNLLRDDGVIFISIDDVEQPSLRKLCDEVFGQENFISNIIWQKKYSPQNDARHISDMHDHILLYAKTKNSWSPTPLPRTEKQDAAYKNPDDDPRGPWKATDSTCNKSNTERPNLYYPIQKPNGEETWPLKTRVWRYSKDVHMQKETDNRVWWGKNKNNDVPAYKSFLSEVKSGRVPVSIWTYKEAGHNQEARQELNKLIEGNSFNTPKPTKLIRLMSAIALAPEDDAIILDFFAGSASTADALFQSNAHNNSFNRFILVQLPETALGYNSNMPAFHSSIAEISKERIRRAGVKILEENPDQISNLDIGFRVLKIDESNMNDVYYSPSTLAQTNLLDTVEHIKADRTSEDLLFQVMLDWGVDLALPIVRETHEGKLIYWVGDNALSACFEMNITEDLIKTIAAKKPLRAVFRDDGFGSDDMKINAGQLFKQITDGHTDMKVI